MPHGEHDLEKAFNDSFSDGKGNLLIPAEMREPLISGLIKAVELATTRATEALRDSDIYRYLRGAVLLAAVITAVVVAAICVPVTYILATEGRRHNCQLITKLASLQRERIVENKSSTERFKHESADRLGLSPKRFQELIEEGEQRENRQLETYNEVANTTC